MFNIVDDMNGAIKQLMEDQAKEPGECKVDIITFDTDIDVEYEDADPLSVAGNVIKPRGNTALNDAIGFGIVRLGNRFRLMNEEDRPARVIFVVVTDGMENASREYTHAQVKRMVEQQTNQWNWTFMYLAANVDAFATGAGYGFTRGQTIAFAASGAGTQNVVGATSANLTRARKGDYSGYTQDEREAAEET